MTLLRLASLSLACAALLACGGEAKPAHDAASERAEPPPAPPATTPESKGCAVTANGNCFKTSAEACAALACPARKCQVAYSDPVEATCR